MAKNKFKFYIRLYDRCAKPRFEEREGYLYEGIEGIKIGIHKENTSRWVATELSTGLYCGYAGTKKEAIEGLHLKEGRIRKAMEQHDNCSAYVKAMNEFRKSVGEEL